MRVEENVLFGGRNYAQSNKQTLRIKVRLRPCRMATKLTSLQKGQRGNWEIIGHKNLQSRNEGCQSDAQVEGCLQAEGERDVDLGVDIDQIRAIAAAIRLVRVETGSDFLKRRVSEADGVPEIRWNLR